MIILRKVLINIISKRERTSCKGPKGVITIEAALALPVFIFAMLTLISVIDVHATRVKMHMAMLNAGKQAAVYMIEGEHLNKGKLKSDIVKDIGQDRIENSFISGGKSGIDVSDSYYSSMTGEINLKVKYDIKLPFPDFTGLRKTITEEGKIRAWNGYYKVVDDPEDDEIVYVTKHGTVYHTDYNCTYLKPAIHFVPYNGLGSYRNNYGKKYKKCEKCVHGESVSGVYVTENGEKYHNSLKCSGLKRTVYAVKKKDAEGKGECSKCSQ